MATFPASNIAYSNRSPGQTIASAHINSLQDEVAAIEDGYLNGTARLNSSHSTVAAISVSGGSTLGTVQAGNSTVAALSVTGNSTLDGALQVGGASTFASTSVVFAGPIRVDGAVGSSGSTGLSLGRPSTGVTLGSTSQVAWLRIKSGTGANSTYYIPLFR